MNDIDETIFNFAFDFNSFPLCRVFLDAHTQHDLDLNVNVYIFILKSIALNVHYEHFNEMRSIQHRIFNYYDYT